VRRLPQSLDEAISALEASDLLRDAMGEPMAEAFLAVRRAEIELFSGASPAEVVARTRWRW
jgi:glutamine synthetase